jgi:P-type conjugative transfer protein TrbJ
MSIRRGLFLIVCVLAIATPARAQVVVADPVVEKMQTQAWFKQLQQAETEIQTATSAANSLKQQIQQTQALQQSLTASPQQIFRQVQAELTGLESVTSIGYAVTAHSIAAGQQLQLAFPQAAPGQLKSALQTQWNQAMSDTLTGTLNGASTRYQQMNSEEGQLAALRSLSQGSVGVRDTLQIIAQIAFQQLEEMRSMERLMLQQQAAQAAYAYQHGSSGTQAFLSDVVAMKVNESFWAGKPVTSQ